MLAHFPRRSPTLWDQLAQMQREVSRLAESPRSRVYPPANFYKSADGYLLRFEMPGVDPSSLEINTQRSELTVTGERAAPEVEDGASYHRRERRFGRFRRTFTLPDTVDTESTEALYRNGVLEIRMRKKAAAQPRTIQVATA